MMPAEFARSGVDTSRHEEQLRKTLANHQLEILEHAKAIEALKAQNADLVRALTDLQTPIVLRVAQRITTRAKLAIDAAAERWTTARALEKKNGS